MTLCHQRNRPFWQHPATRGFNKWRGWRSIFKTLEKRFLATSINWWMDCKKRDANSKQWLWPFQTYNIWNKSVHVVSESPRLTQVTNRQLSHQTCLHIQAALLFKNRNVKSCNLMKISWQLAPRSARKSVHGFQTKFWVPLWQNRKQEYNCIAGQVYQTEEIYQQWMSAGIIMPRSDEKQ